VETEERRRPQWNEETEDEGDAAYLREGMVEGARRMLLHPSHQFSVLLCVYDRESVEMNDRCE